MKLRALFLLCFTVLLSTCSGGQDQPDAAPIDHDCLEPKHFFIFNEEAIRSDCFDSEGVDCDLPGLAFPKGSETRLKIRAFDDEGRLCDPSLTSVEFETADFSAAADGDDFLVTATRDIFDEAVVEPSTVMTVSQGPLVSRWQALAVVDIAGTWEITVDDLTVGDFEVTQSGRFIRWSQCEPEDTRPECSAGEINADMVQLQSPVGALTLEGTIVPTRDWIDGSWTGDGDLMGQWYAKKMPE